MTTNNIIILAAILFIILIGIVIHIMSSRNTYLAYLKTNLIMLAENILEGIIDNEPGYTIQDIIDFNISESDLHLNCIQFIKSKMYKYVDSFITDNVTNKIVAKMLRDLLKIDDSIVSDALESVLTADDGTIYNGLLQLLSNHSKNVLSEMEKEDKEAKEIAESYENETITVDEYNGEFDKSEYDIARENFESTEIEYPEEENIDDIPEELVEIIAQSESDFEEDEVESENEN